MRVWAAIIDSQPAYAKSGGRTASLLLAPFGTTVLAKYVATALRLVTDNAPIVVAPEGADAAYAASIEALCPKAQVVFSTASLSAALPGHELSDALLFVDPRCTPVEGLELRQLMQYHATEPRLAHHLIAFERAIDGTRECVSVDSGGQVREIQRFYERTTWPFMAGIAATVIPSAGNVLNDRFPGSLADLRQLLVGRGIVSRDVPMEGRALDLTNEYELLAANERLILEAVANGSNGDGTASTVFIGTGHQIDDSARLLAAVVIHAGASIEAGATVLGPAVIGPGATIGSGSIVAHALIGAGARVGDITVVRDRAWFATSQDDNAIDAHASRDVSFSERLARLSADSHGTAMVTRHHGHVRLLRTLAVKRALDVTMAVLGLLITAPILILAAIAIWLESKGPIFYGDRREGLGGFVFSCWKFRTMFTGAHLAQRDLKALDQTDGPHFKVDRDPRVTRVGRVLRALNADEIPQLFNVLRGQMSIVGPRPSPFRENQVCVPWRAARLSVRPGITGFWQVCRHNRAAGDFHQWIEYDLLYVQHLSLLLDLKILAATMLTLGGKVAHVNASWLVGAQSGVEELLPETSPDQKAERQVA